MIPYDTPVPGPLERHSAPRTALTPKIVAHGSQSNIRVLKGNPIGHIQHPDGKYHPYFSARMEHTHQPVEHAMLNSVDVDHYHLGQVVPSRANPANLRRISPSATPWHEWPDTSVSASFQAHPVFGGLSHPGGDFPAASPYTPRSGQG